MDVLFGRINPGGKLPLSFPRPVGELPVYYNRNPSTDQVIAERPARTSPSWRFRHCMRLGARGQRILRGHGNTHLGQLGRVDSGLYRSSPRVVIRRTGPIRPEGLSGARAV